MKITVFFVCVSINMQKIVCNIYCREFEAVIHLLHHCVRARLLQRSTFRHDTRHALDQSSRMNKLQSAPPGHGQILTTEDIKLRAFVTASTSICVVTLELPPLVAPDVPTIAYTFQRFYFQMHHVGAQYSLLSPVATYCGKIG